MLCIVNGQPRILTLREILKEFIGFRREVVTRRTLFQLRKAEERHHIVMGLKIALDHLDAVIKLIRAAASPRRPSKASWPARFATAAQLKKDPALCLSDRQAQAILDMRLQRLTGLEREKILEELAELEKTIAQLKAILDDDKLLMSVIREEFQAVAEQFGNDRCTEIAAFSGNIRMEDVVPDEEMVVTMSKAGYIKRTALAAYRRQKRGGKGKLGMKTKDEDFVEQLFLTKAHDTLLVFTDRGYAYALKVYDLPEAAASTRGKHIKNLISLKDEEKVVTLMALREFPEDHHLVFATADGTVKKTSLSSYANIRSNGLIALNIDEGNRLVSVRVSTGNQQIVLISALGKAIRFPEEDIRAMGRTATGVRGMRLGSRRRDRGHGSGRVPARPGGRGGAGREHRHPRHAAHGHREGLRQAQPAPGLPAPGPGRHRGHQHPGRGAQRQGGGLGAGEARRRLPAHLPGGHGHPLQHRRGAQDRPGRHGRAPAEPALRRTTGWWAWPRSTPAPRPWTRRRTWTWWWTPRPATPGPTRAACSRSWTWTEDMRAEGS